MRHGRPRDDLQSVCRMSYVVQETDSSVRYAQVGECGEREVKWLAYSRTHEDQQADDDGTAPTGHLEKQELVFNDADVAEKRERERERETWRRGV